MVVLLVGLLAESMILSFVHQQHHLSLGAAGEVEELGALIPVHDPVLVAEGHQQRRLHGMHFVNR